MGDKAVCVHVQKRISGEQEEQSWGAGSSRDGIWHQNRRGWLIAGIRYFQSQEECEDAGTDAGRVM